MSAKPPVLFTEEMKKTYTILAPTMLPMHFKIISNIMISYGYRVEVLETSGRHIIETGLKYVHNDTCYPALLVIGQLIDALQCGRYDVQKTALLITQTGGGCRASNYLSLLRKALEKAGLGFVPVISLNVVGLEKHPGFKLTLPMVHKMLYGVLYGDLLMLLRNQCIPYEINPGESEALANRWALTLAEDMRRSRVLRYRHIRDNYRRIIRDFAQIPRSGEEKLRVGIVGEIYVKFSPLGNNDLEKFLISEGAEPVMPGLLDFCLYCVVNQIIDRKLYNLRPVVGELSKVLYRWMVNKQKDIIAAVKEIGDFRPMTCFDDTLALAEGTIGKGMKMGEGWLLTSEMLELAEQGVGGIVCTQPFGCLPNHIAGKGMMKPIREGHPEVNIVAIDYDPGATAINQENRIKLMLANARSQREARTGEKAPVSSKQETPWKKSSTYAC